MIGKDWKKEITMRTADNSSRFKNEHKDRFVKEYVSKAKKNSAKTKVRSPKTISKTSLKKGHQFTSKVGPKTIRL